MDLSPLLPAIDAAVGVELPSAGGRVRLGVGDNARAAVIAALLKDSTRPALIIVPKAHRAGDLLDEMSSWLGPGVASRLRLYPQRDILPYERAADDPWDARARLEATALLSSDSDVILIAPIEAVAQRTLSPAAARAAFSSISVGDRVGSDTLMRRLQASGYETVSLVEAPGQVARRGGIVDVFPPQASQPARVEFFGPEVESIRLFDPATQRSSERVQTLQLGVASEFSPSLEMAQELLETLDFEVGDGEAAADLREELLALTRGEPMDPRSFVPHLLSLFSLLDHVPADATVVLYEPSDIVRALDEYVAETATMRLEREARGELPIGLPPAQANWADLQPRLTALPTIELGRFETEESGAVRPPFVQAPGYGGRVRVLALDLQDAVCKREAVYIISQQGSRLLTLLRDEGLPVRADGEDGGAPEPGVIQILRGSLPHGWVMRASPSPTGPTTGKVANGQTGKAPLPPSSGSGAIEQSGRVPSSTTLARERGRVGRPGVGAAVLPSVETGGFSGGLTLLTDAEVFGFVKQRRALRQPGHDRTGLVADLTPGDYVVHLEHGIARFERLIVREVEGVQREFLELAYAQGDRLFVPVDQSDRVARYVGPGEMRPDLTRLGGGEWQRTRDRVRRAVADVAHDLLDLYAARQMLQGHAFGPDTPWQQELEASFPYIETPDQLAAIGAVKEDMEAERPMDRLICGDVGFGKTEVAIRAAFKAVMDGYQVGMLVPTTVLAQQHYNTFRERLASLPARVEMLSRFLNDKEAREVAAGVAAGEVDILIGTHRILQKDISFKKLGLVIIDEEQRFGVAHKERLKQMRKEVDVLTLSATPIPRTLHMSMAGIRDLSNMTTPPEDRTPIRTYVMESDDQIIREAIAREVERGGQVFFVHNRVYNIELIAARIKKLLPDIEVGIGHGQMHEDQLEKTMLAFARGELDVLVCTTIIESGLDIPNANTIIINQANRLGLAQLYQLRGRVGRGSVRAYAYLLYDRGQALSELAQRRLQAVFEATELGAGFQIAMRDLEIRGAGNLLGVEQSGNMAAVGFDLYVRLLAEAVERLKAMQRGEMPKEPASARPAVSLDLPITAYLPEGYIPDLNMRLAVYQRISGAENDAEVAALEKELVDRFGPLPPAARNLAWVVRLRLMATASGVGTLNTEEGAFVLRLMPGKELDRNAVMRKLPPASSATSHQVRLSRAALGEGWREGLVRALDAISGAISA